MGNGLGPHRWVVSKEMLSDIKDDTSECHHMRLLHEEARSSVRPLWKEYGFGFGEQAARLLVSVVSVLVAKGLEPMA